MPITLSPLVLKDATITLTTAGGTTPVEYRCQLNEARLIPSKPTSSGGGTFETFCETHNAGSSSGGSVWVLRLNGFQAYGDATDLSRFLFAHEGEELDYVVTPKGGTPSATNPSYEGVCIAFPMEIGGTANQFATASVDLDCTGKPTEVVA